jgi:uncharacterized membrane protein YedE/YeeE
MWGVMLGLGVVIAVAFGAGLITGLLTALTVAVLMKDSSEAVSRLPDPFDSS